MRNVGQQVKREALKILKNKHFAEYKEIYKKRFEIRIKMEEKVESIK
jgi:hypothetical protein